MLRILVQVFTLEGRAPASKRALLGTSVDTMHALSSIAETLTYLAADEALPGVRGGVTFASFAKVAEGAASEAPPSGAAPPPRQSGSTSREIARGRSLLLTFDAIRCIHSRHCLTELPHMFQASTPGAWLFPDEADAELLSAVVRECPSGALQYERLDNGAPEPVPPVNLIRLSENGPYAALADLDLAGRNVGYRATLCRCGKSENKPFCDHSHAAAGFQASSEPATLETAALVQRGNTLRIDPQRNGPLAVTGNLELCAGTGRVILRTAATHLCRCEQSKNKTLCDGSHVGAGFISEEANPGDKAGDRPPNN